MTGLTPKNDLLVKYCWCIDNLILILENCNRTPPVLCLVHHTPPPILTSSITNLMVWNCSLISLWSFCHSPSSGPPVQPQGQWQTTGCILILTSMSSSCPSVLCLVHHTPPPILTSSITNPMVLNCFLSLWSYHRPPSSGPSVQTHGQWVATRCILILTSISSSCPSWRPSTALVPRRVFASFHSARTLLSVS